MEKSFFLSGPDQWQRRKVTEVTERPFPHKGATKQARFFVLDQPITPLAESKGGFMILGDKPNLGRIHASHPHWNSEKNRLEYNDVRPDGFGVAALRLAGAEIPSRYRFVTHDQRHAELNGTWKVRFWAKSPTDSEATLDIEAQVLRKKVNNSVTVPTRWTQFEEEFVIEGIADPQTAKDIIRLNFCFLADGQDVLLDDIEIWMEGHTNPTAFTDDCVAALKKYNPGILRTLQMGGSTIDNFLSPRLRMRGYASQQGMKNSPDGRMKTYSYSMPEFYELCEEIGAEPWYCLPGTILPEELEQFLEYIAGDETTPYGKRRAADGHPKPWTDTFSRIHIQFGNEAWNNASDYQCGGFNGYDYWQDLISKGKASKNYRKNLVFHTGGQASHPHRNKGLIENATNTDAFTLAPYITHGLKQEDMSAWETDEDFFRWAFAWPIDRSLTEGRSMTTNYETAQSHNIELSTYEVNHHITNGDGPLEPRNKLVTSISGGINVANAMLLMLKEQGIRNQCLFSLIQHSYKAPAGPVRLWGTTLNMRKGFERYRPTSLAARLANRVMDGNLVTTTHSENQPTFTAKGRFENKEPDNEVNFPTIWSYAFQDGKRHGLILINLDTTEEQQTVVKFEGNVASWGALVHTLTGATLDANNEFEQEEPQVTIDEVNLPNFQSGSPLNLPPHSMVVVEWMQEN